MMEQSKINELTKHYHSITPEDVVGVSFAKKRVNGKLTNEDAIVFKVKNKKPLDEIPEDEVLPSEIEFEGVKYKTDVDEGEFRLLATRYCPSSFYNWPTNGLANRSKVRPIKGGISVTNYTSSSNSVGTLGFLAVDTDTGSLVGVSNSHVLVKNAFLASEREVSGTHTSVYNNFVTQPNDGSDSGLQSSIGLVKRYVPLSGGTSYNTVDGALTTVNQSDINGETSYTQYGISGWKQPLEFATTTEIDGLVTNKNNLFSSGRTTGPKGEGDTKLFAKSLGDTITIKYNNQGVEEVIYFSECITFIASAATTPTGDDCFYPSAPGDSGSALVADFNGTRKIVGLVFAASGYTALTNNQIVYYVTEGLANRIDNVAEQLSISAWTGNTVYYSDTGSTQLHTVQGLSSDINLDLSGDIYWQAGTEI